MGTLQLFELVLRGSDCGEPIDRDQNGVRVELLDINGYVHLQTSPGPSEGRDVHLALFSLSEAKGFRDALDRAIQRVEKLGES